MASRRIAVDITGDPTNLERALIRSEAAIKRFGQTAQRSAGLRDPISQLNKGFDKLDETIRSDHRRSQSLGPLRLAGIGVGAGIGLYAATQAAGRLSTALELTGKQAFTTGGRLRNMGAAFVTGDFVGGLQAAGRAPKTLDDLGLSAFEASQKLEAVGLKAHEAVDGTQSISASAQKARDSYNEFAAATGKASLENQDLITQLKNVVGAMGARRTQRTHSQTRTPGWDSRSSPLAAGSPCSRGWGQTTLVALRGRAREPDQREPPAARGGRFGRPGRLPDIAGTRNQKARDPCPGEGRPPRSLAAPGAGRRPAEQGWSREAPATGNDIRLRSSRSPPRRPP